MFKPSKKLDAIPFSPIRKLFDEIARLRNEGKDVISLGIGEPDFDTPANITEAMAKAAREGETHYTANKGIMPLRKAIIEYLSGNYGLNYDAEEIITTVGVAEGIYIALSAYLDPGDEMLFPDPAWVNYSHVPVMNGATPISYVLRPENNFQIDVEGLEALVTEKTKIFVLLDPSNPIGAVQSKETLEKLAKFLVKHDLLVISDEIYDQLLYDGVKHYSIASFPGMFERTIVLNGFSKTYAMTGWRLGYVAAPIALIPPMAKMHAYLVTNATSMAQFGAAEALTGPQDSVKIMVDEFQRRRDYVVKSINAIDGLSCLTPEGAFYVFVDVSGTGLTGEEFCRLMLDGGVGVVPGTAFGKSAVDFIRISYAVSMEQLEVAMGRIKKAVDDYMSQK